METLIDKATWRESRTKLKNMIKALAVDQKIAKHMLRKVKYGTDEWRDCCKALKKDHSAHWGVQSDVAVRKAVITATLNFYNAFRGRPYRHNSRVCVWHYKDVLEKLEKEFGSPDIPV